jgi:Tfp pilus assembly protein PilN
MNAVNLIPADRRKRSAGISVSPFTLGVIGGLVVVLVAAVLYVFAVNDVRARKSELARVTANAASWKAAASSYASYVTAAQQQKQQLADIQQLVTGRFPWSPLLSQIGGVMPADAALSSLQATSPSSDSTAAAAASGTTTSSPSTTQAVQIGGCAASQSAVAATMVALGRVHGVGSVALASTSSSATGSSSSGTGSSGGSSSSGGGCPFPVTFTLSLILAPSASSAATSAATTPTSTPTSPAATPAASTSATPSTGSAQ